MEKGQTVYMLNIENRYRHNREFRYDEVTVETVGRKYITVKKYIHSFKFDKETMLEHSDYSPAYMLFETREQVELYIEKQILTKKLLQRFNNELGNLSNEELRTILNILNSRKQPNP